MTDLFGNKIHKITNARRRQPKTLFSDYDGFVEKFEPKKTTDDCFTPSDIYDIVLRYVAEKCNIKGREIIRPFYPGNDYEVVNYPAGCVVVDNPPFSIIAKIARFYIERKIDFFLFAPHLTLFSADLDCTRIVAGANIEYENGAKVKTSFLSNMFGDVSIMGEPRIFDEVEEINKKNQVKLPKYVYPHNVLTVSMVQKWVESGIGIRFQKKEIERCAGLESQRAYGKVIFGGGYLLSEKAATEKSAAERAAKKAMEKKAAEKTAAENANVVEWELSPREWDIISNLG